tara:strand:- start:2872 stop:3798 length:927 start_codon:yes stop_codon:yes gene_type:complete
MQHNPFFQKMSFTKEEKNSVILNCLNKQGIAIIKNWINAKDVNVLKNELDSIEAKPPKWVKKNKYETGCIIDYAPLQRHINHELELLSNITNVLSSKRIKDLAISYLGKNAVPDRMLLHRSESSNKPITTWHIDNFSTSKRALKFFLYLSDSDKDTGAFSYIPGCRDIQQLVNTRAKTYDDLRRNMWSIDQNLEHWKQEAILQEKKGNKKISSQITNHLQNIMQHVNSELNSDDYYTVSAKKGSLIIFDPVGFHRGGRIIKGERYIIRAHYLPFSLKRAFSSRNELSIFVKRNVIKLKAKLKGKSIYI